ncbi:glycerol-3-phosphate acyltransferase mino isoform X2 [Leptinotarsa decemlineata]|uniref:glycerol-3-phosphate acyltransferase mino isoform X2 n=1 Tax=Leptinotarsa decemlineata TaxID=7539 RepID=UPI003D30BFC6
MVVFSGTFVAWTMESILEFSIFLGFLYWAFPTLFSSGFVRVNKMVDIVTNRVFDTYNRFSPSNNHHTESISTLSTLKRFSRDQKFKRASNREADIKAREEQLFDLKTNKPEVVLSRRRPFMGWSCQNCAAKSRESLVTKTTETLALRNILDYQLPHASNGFFQRTFSHLHQAYTLKKYDYPQVADLVLKDERVVQAIVKATDEQIEDSNKRGDEEFYQLLLGYNEKRSRKLLYNMRSTLSDFLLRFTSWVLYKLLPCFLTSVVVHPGQVEMVKKAGQTGLPLVFLPLHRSHLDYILMSFVLLNNNIKAPLVAAGDNLRIPFFGSLLRGLGAFFIKRRIDPVMGRKDIIYKSVLHTYMNTFLRAGHNVEFFLEGGRTRTGKPCMPKYGILSVILESFMDGTIEDALLVPVSINYEKLVDGNFVREQLGKPKEMETFKNAMAGIWKVLNSSYGMMRLDFNQPMSLKELVKTFNTNGRTSAINGLSDKKSLKSKPSNSSIYGTDLVCNENKLLVESISKHIIYDCAQSTSVMSTNALAYLLLTKYREGVNIKELVVALDDLRNDMMYVRKDIGFTGDSIDVINYAVRTLGPALVRKEKVNNEDIIKPIAILPNVIELSYYSNTLVTHYALESVIAITVQLVANHRGEVVHQDLIDNVLELCDILQYEFLFCKPCQSLEQTVTSCVEDLLYRKRIFLFDEDEYELSESRMRCRRLAKHLVEDDEPSEFYPQKIYMKNNEKEAVEYLNHLVMTLLPLVETYAVTAFTLDKLVGRQLIESELVKDVLNELKMQLDMGTVKYGESVSVDSIKNALRLFQRWGILECHSEKKIRLYYLAESQDDSESIETVYDKVNKFRQSFQELP